MWSVYLLGLTQEMREPALNNGKVQKLISNKTEVK